MLTEKESFIVYSLRNPLIGIVKNNHRKIDIDELSNDEVLTLYNKMDKYIEEEGHIRKSLNSYDEIYVLELLNVKSRLEKELELRNQNNGI